MPDRRNKWDECHRIYPKIGEILDWANEIDEERTWPGATHFLTATAIASSGDPLAPRGLIRSLIHGEGVISAGNTPCRGNKETSSSQVPSAHAELRK